MKKLNANLPNDIKIHEILPVAPSFDAWDWASHRHYSYVMPTYALAEFGISLKDAVDYRISSNHLWHVRKVVLDFIGGRNFINFTDIKKLQKDFPDKAAFERSCFRYLFDARIDDPFLYKGVEFCTVHFKVNISLCFALINCYRLRNRTFLHFRAWRSCTIKLGKW